MNILTDAGFTHEEAEAIVEALVRGTDLHDGSQIDIDALPPGKKEALDRFNVAVAADA